MHGKSILAVGVDSGWHSLVASPSLSFLSIALAFMPLNWLLETLKWQSFFPSNSPLRFWTLLAAVLAGQSVALITPNRMGDILGRLWIIPRSQHAWAIPATVGAAYCQFTALLLGGLIGTIGLIQLPTQAVRLYNGLYAIMIGSSAALLVLLMVGRFLPGRLANVIKSVKGKSWKKMLTPFARLARYDIYHLKSGLFWGGLRYIIYSMQYVALLNFFGAELSFFVAWAGVAAIFLLQTGIPLPPIAGVVARGELALLIWVQLGADDTRILMATYGLFAINLIIPASVGFGLLLRKNLTKSNEYG